eukprot:TRINITY_DN29447_c0_g1_i1.p1 TRINITY_DN29447_c0_g1~~TRINITY_DN29447_c0_g1_i1.p1  ORF type:complete len:134 (+),score=22.00 TRINITY_DN29447_c0_g1_i1:45-446(+)
MSATHTDPSKAVDAAVESAALNTTVTGRAATIGALQESFSSFHNYVEAEARLSQEQWRFLALCNQKVEAEFNEVAQHADVALSVVGQTNDCISNAVPEGFVLDLEQLERNLDALETVSKGVEEYSLALERRYL